MVNHNRSTTQAIGEILKIFEETGVVTPVHNQFVRSTESIAAVSENVAKTSF